jgi:hypothetical protein
MQALVASTSARVKHKSASQFKVNTANSSHNEWRFSGEAVRIGSSAEGGIYPSAQLLNETS